MEGQAFKQAVLEEVQKLQVERRANLARLEVIDRKLAACNVILEDEGNSTPPRSTVKLERGERPKTIELVKEIVMASGTAGILPREVRGELEKAGVVLSPQVVSTALSRWRKRDYTVEIDGRYYWKAYLSDIELQKVRPRKRRDLTRRTWEPPTASPSESEQR